MRLDENLLQKLLRFLGAPGNMQLYAFGTQLRQTLDRFKTVEMDKVSTLKKLDKFVLDFILSVCSEINTMVDDEIDFPTIKCQCTKMEKSTLHCCMHKWHHDG
jgi:hypothetical protein